MRKAYKREKSAQRRFAAGRLVKRLAALRAPGFLGDRAYLAVAALVLIVPLLVVDLRVRWTSLPAVPMGDFLASLHNNTEVGCYGLSRLDPDYVFVGDSHAYAAIDYMRLGELLGVDRVGSCALPGAFLPSISLFLDWLSQTPRRPTLIYVTSPRQFMSLGEQDRRLEQHRELLFDPQRKARAKTRWLDAAENGKAVFGRTHDEETARFARHAPRIEAIDEAAFTARLKSAMPPHLSKWREELPDWRPSARIDHQIENFCAKVRKLGITLHLVHTPESPLAHELYSDRQWDAYLDHIRRFDCAKSVLVMAPAYIGIGNRHFTNRMFADAFDYDRLADTSALAALQQAEWYTVLDLDHPNRLGARIITDELVARLGLR